MRTIKIKADTYRQDYNYRECKQNDDITLEVTLLEGGVELDLSGYTITLNWVKSDSTVVTIAGDTIKVIGNIVSLILPRDCTRAVGQAKFELVITDNTSKQISTFPLSLEIIGSVIQGQQASNNVATLTEELNNANIAAINTKNELKDVIDTADLTTYASQGQMQEVNSQLADIVQQTHYINPCDDPQLIFNNGAIGDKFVFVKGTHIHKPINNGAILYVDKKSTIELSEGAILKIEDNSVLFNSTPEIITNFSNVAITLNDLMVGGTYDNTTASAYCIQIDSVGLVDTFKWSRNWNGGSTVWNATNIPITGSFQTLENGIQIKFEAVTGHVLNSLWIVCYGVNPYYGIRIGTGLQNEYIDGVTICGKGIIDINKNNQFLHNEYTKFLPSCILADGRVSNIEISDVAMINGARPVQMYGEHTGVYNLDGTTTGGVSYDINGVIIKNTKIQDCSVGHIFGFPEHRGKVKNVSFYNNLSVNVSPMVELNHGLESYNMYGNIYNATNNRQMFSCWRHSKNGTIHDNIMIGDTTGTIPMVTFSAPALWQQPEGLIEYNNINMENFSNGLKSIVFGDMTNKAIGNYSTVIGGLSNESNGKYSSILGGELNRIETLKQYSTITGGKSNIINSDYSNINGGTNNNVSGDYSNINGGASNTISAIKSSISGGSLNVVSASDSTITGGALNNATKQYSRVHGLEGSTDWKGEDVLASGKFAVVGDAKISRLCAKAVSTTDSYVALQNHGELITVPTSTNVGYRILIVGKSEDGLYNGIWKAEGLAVRNGSGSVVLAGNTVTKVYSNGSLWDCVVEAYNSPQSINIKVKGNANQKVRWVADVELTVVKF